jgi:NAD(P)-dependent dehydrogenase (short-subunit alcohol dehydrogenase family)|tara:strand:+ start:201 stop:458 length:258 start_codon:yes stop_codon:yes gene_type:complete
VTRVTSRREHARTRLTVNAIAPAAIEASFLQGVTDVRREVQKSVVPMGRFGEPSEAAALVEFIASDPASFTTGFAYDLSSGGPRS